MREQGALQIVDVLSQVCILFDLSGGINGLCVVNFWNRCCGGGEAK